VPAPQSSGDGGHLGAVTHRVERVDGQAEVGHVAPDLGDLVDLERPVEHQSSEDVGDFVGQHSRGVQVLTGQQPTFDGGAGGMLSHVGHQRRNNHARVDDDAHRR